MFRKSILLAFIVLFTFCKSQGDKKSDLISVPGPIEFAGTEFFLDWANRPSKTMFVQQYLPKDENYKEFNQLISITLFNKDIDLEEAVQQKVADIENKKKDDKYATANVTESPDRKEFIVDFITSTKPEKGTPFVEYNLYRFKKIENGENKQLVIFDYAQRMYGGDFKASSKALLKSRNTLMNNVITFALPEVKVISSTPKTASEKPAEAKPEVKKEEPKEQPKTAPEPVKKPSKSKK